MEYKAKHPCNSKSKIQRETTKRSHVFDKFAIYHRITRIHIGKVYIRVDNAGLLHDSFKTNTVRLGYVILQRLWVVHPLSLPTNDFPIQLANLILPGLHILFQLTNLKKQIRLLLSPTTLLLPKTVYLHHLCLKTRDLRLKLAPNVEARRFAPTPFES